MKRAVFYPRHTRCLTIQSRDKKFTLVFIEPHVVVVALSARYVQMHPSQAYIQNSFLMKKISRNGNETKKKKLKPYF